MKITAKTRAFKDKAKTKTKASSLTRSIHIEYISLYQPVYSPRLLELALSIGIQDRNNYLQIKKEDENRKAYKNAKNSSH